MTIYQVFLLIGIGAGAILNAYTPRSLALSFLLFFFLFLIPALLPSPDYLEGTWFLVLISLEVSMGFFALASRTRIGLAIAGFSLWNCCGHLLGLIAYSYDSDWYNSYGPIIQSGETMQVLSLIVLSRPLINLVVWMQTGKQGDNDGWHHVQHNPS